EARGWRAGGANHFAGGGSEKSFKKGNTKFPGNCISDRGGKDGGGEASQRSSVCLKARPRPRRFRLMHDGGVSKCEDSPRPPRYTPSAGRGSRVAGAGSGNRAPP